MSFVAIKGDDLDQFDEETRALYGVRTHDPRISYVLASAVRRNRHNLPVVVDSENPYIQKL